MNNDEIKELIHLIDQSSLKYFELEDSSVSLKLSKRESDSSNQTQSHSSEQPNTAPSDVSKDNGTQKQEPKVNEVYMESVEDESEPDESLHLIKSPIVGTSYRSSSPDSPAFVKAGDTVEVGQTVLIIEAMKVMNEIKSDVSGVIEEILVDDGQAIEFDQALIKIKAD